jgi:NCS1 family nucleobase:cation symporter-1
MTDQMVELRENISQSKLYNKDLAPTLIKQRVWNTYNYAALWVGMAHCIPTYMLAGGLIALGMNWKEALFTITLGNLIVLIPMLLNSHPGTKYGIPFPILARASFGVFGANIPALLRAGVACGWFGIQTFIGGAAINMLFSVLIPGWKTLGGSFSIAGLSLPLAITFMIFWLIQLYIIFRGMDVLRRFENWAAPVVIALALALVVWMITAVHGFGPLLAEPSKFKSFGEFFAIFIPSLTGMVGFWATLALNIPDFTRFAKDQKKQMVGQSIGLPPTMLVFSAMGVIITSATVLLYGKAMWDPVEVISRFSNTFVLLLGFFGIIVATLSVNIAANVVSPANDFSNLIPKYISFRMGGLITGIIGILIMPWRLLADPSGYIFGWLTTYSGFLGPIAGIIIADYWLVRRRNLHLADLYKREGAYAYSGGFNWKAIIALVLGIVVALIGRLIPSLKILFDYAWFVGFAVAFIVYSLSMISETREETGERKIASAA